MGNAAKREAITNVPVVVDKAAVAISNHPPKKMCGSGGIWLFFIIYP
ncbi:MAG: hypothetical protein M3162_07160 [Thermoproteota archaeon]|nr:hypothetical protein [Thermoproteota archaeon]